MIISSKENSKIKEIKKLKQSKFAKDYFLVEGKKMVNEAINENAEIRYIAVNKEFARKSDFENIRKKIKLNEESILEVSDNIFKSISNVNTPQGILAVVKIPKFDDKILGSEKLKNIDYLVALDDIQDPGNLGTIIRTLDAAGLKNLIISKNAANPYSEKVVRSTMGSIFRINIFSSENLEITLKKLQDNGFKIVATDLRTNKYFYDIDYSKTCIIIGNEGNGVSKNILNLADEKVKIPMNGKAESLNASVASGLMIYEYVRQNFNK